MSLEQALAENTIALNRVAELLTISNADRAKLIEANGGAPATSAPAASAPADNGMTVADNGMTVADIKEAAKTADKATLEKMLADEVVGKNRTTAVDAIKAALAALEPADTGNSEPTVGAAESNSPASAQAASPSSAPSADDKNAQPVPAEVSGEQAAKAFGGWFGETDDEDDRAKRRGFVEQIVAKLGSKVSELDLEGRRKAIFYLRRRRAALPVDFEAAYDFNGSPTQDAPSAAEAPAASGDDDLL